MTEADGSVRVEPMDEYNRRLVANVHPPDWNNPNPKPRYHLVVVGAGTAGLVTAIGAAGLGANVALVERHLMGGDCLNVGCVPSKGVISAARAWHARANGSAFGLPDGDAGGNFAAAMERMRRLRAGISSNDGARRLSELGVDVFLGQGSFVARDRIEVGGKTLSFRRAAIATGARAIALPIPGLAESGFLTNETIFSLTELPPRLVVIGAGPIGCEMAQSFASFGSRVTVLDAGDHVLPREDPDAAEVVQQRMLHDGVRYVAGVTIKSVERKNGAVRVAYESDGKILEVCAEHLLLGVGRAPNTEGLGLEAAGVEYGRQGVSVDDRLRTTNKRIYACGDIASPFKFTHTADAQARIVIQNALFFGRAKTSALVIPWCTYTTPEIAHVGMYERDANDAGLKVDTITIPLSEVDRAVLDGEDDGFLRVHLKHGSDRILGATLVAHHAGDMLGELALACTNGIGLAKIGKTIHPYPTQGEIIRKAADAWRRTKLTPKAKKLFSFWFRVFR